MDRSNGGRAGSSVGSNGTWKKLWQLKVLPKVRMTFWRACQSILATRVNLWRCYLPKMSEDRGNCIYSLIDSMQRRYGGSKFGTFRGLARGVFHGIFELLQQRDQKMAEKFVMLLRRIW